MRSPCRKRLHTQNVPHLSKGPPQLVPALRAPPQGCPVPILGRSVITYFRYADTYAGRPRLSSLVSRRVRMPTALSPFVSNVPYNPPNHTISNPTPDSCSLTTSSGPPRILLTPISGLAPAGAAPANIESVTHSLSVVVMNAEHFSSSSAFPLPSLFFSVLPGLFSPR